MSSSPWMCMSPWRQPDTVPQPRMIIPWRGYYYLLLGQLVSFAFALMKVCSSLSVNLGVDAPFTLSFFSYVTIAVVYGCSFVYRRQKLLISWYWYLLLAFVDVQGNYLVNKVYQSDITVVSIHGCWMIVLVMIFTWRFLGTNYSWDQLMGVAFSFASVPLSVWDHGDWNRVLGDAFVIAGTVFFVLSNVGEEFFVKKGARYEVITMLGLFGMLVSLIEMAVFEKKNLESVSWSPQLILPLIGYAIAGLMFYTLTPLILQAGGATTLILSLLTTHLWAEHIWAFIHKQNVNDINIFSVTLIVYIVMFVVNTTDEYYDSEDTNGTYQLLNGEEVV